MVDNEKIGDFPTNTRIHIAYPKGKKPTIKFDYPDNQRQLDGLWYSSGILYPAFVISIIIYFMIAISLSLVFFQYPTNCNATLYESNRTHEAFSIDVVCDNQNYTFDYKSELDPASQDSFYGTWDIRNRKGLSSFRALFIVCTWFTLFIVMCKFLAFLVKKTKYGRSKYPLWNKKIHNKRWECTFTKCDDSLKLEIPLFANIYLDYEAEGEFSDYLTNVDIVEHDFNRILRRRIKGKSVKVKNVYLWKCVFTFKKKPKKGFLKVMWT